MGGNCPFRPGLIAELLQGLVILDGFGFGDPVTLRNTTNTTPDVDPPAAPPNDFEARLGAGNRQQGPAQT